MKLTKQKVSKWMSSKPMTTPVERQLVKAADGLTGFINQYNAGTTDWLLLGRTLEHLGKALVLFTQGER